MSYIVKVIFGTLNCTMMNLLPKKKLIFFIKEYKFDSIQEKHAFIKGLNQAIGWIEICVPNLIYINELNEKFSNITSTSKTT